MITEHRGLRELNGSLVILEGVQHPLNEELVHLKLDDGTERTARVVAIEGDKVALQVFEGTRGLSMVNTRTILTGKPMEIPLSPELLGRVFDGLGRPIDGLGEIYPVEMGNVNGKPMNPVSRVYPRDIIKTGISSIDCLTTLIRACRADRSAGVNCRQRRFRDRVRCDGRQERRRRILPPVV